MALLQRRPEDVIHHSDQGTQGEFKRSSQHLRKEEELRWRQASADGRIELCVSPMGSPGRPPLGRREHRQRFWEEVARGLSSEESAVAAGVSPAVGARWFRQCGGMPPFQSSSSVGALPIRSSSEKRLRFFKPAVCGVREIARQFAPLIVDDLARTAAETQQREVENLEGTAYPDGLYNGLH